VITIATLLWDPNEVSFDFSRMYTETWVEKLYRGFARNLTRPFKFVCFSERPRKYCEPIQQEMISGPPDYSSCIQPYRLGAPMILVGLDTVVTGNCDHLADYCLQKTRLAVPRDPFDPKVVCNGVALVPGGHEWVATTHRGENDMDWIRVQRPAVIDDLFPGQVVSYKGHVKQHGLGDARIVYFHGAEKPHELGAAWIREHWA
jgi:hypothetical protein